MGKKETVLITGADGFLGSNLIKSLSDHYNIIGIERDDHIYRRIDIGNLKESVKLYFESELKSIFSKIQINHIIHTATHHGRVFNSFKDVFDTNIEFGLYLLHLADNSKVKYFINIDTVLPKNINIYSYTKNLFSETLEFLASKMELKIINIKMDMIFGPDAGNHNFIQQMLNQLLENKDAIKLTKGDQERSFLYINDVVSAIKLISMNASILPKKPFISFYLIHTHLEKVKNVLISMQRITGSTTELLFGSLPYRDNEIMKTKTDYTFHNLFGWKPKYSFEAGVFDILNTKQ